jgi:hypothetical protein
MSTKIKIYFFILLFTRFIFIEVIYKYHELELNLLKDSQLSIMFMLYLN